MVIFTLQAPCPPGTYTAIFATPDLATCLECPAGSYCVEGTHTPEPCEPGYFCDAGVSVPTPCPAGTYGDIACKYFL